MKKIISYQSALLYGIFSILFFVVFVPTLPVQAATTIYVDSAAADGGNGTSGTPYNTFKDAYAAAAASGDTIDITGTIDWNSAKETADTLYSGFTIGKNLIIQGHGADVTFIQSNSADNTADRRVFTVSTGKTVVIKDMTIRYGNLSNMNSGGCIMTTATSLTLQNIDMYYCRSAIGQVGGPKGGGIYVGGGSLIVDKSSFHNNYGYNGGGAISNASSTITVTNSTLYSNQVTSNSSGGGAIEIVGGTSTLTNNTIRANIGSYGGAFWFSSMPTVYLKNNIIVSNSSINGNDYANLYFPGGIVSRGNNIISTYNSSFFIPAAGDWTDTNNDGTFNLYSVGTTGTLNMTTPAAINELKTYSYVLQAGSIAINNGAQGTNNGVAIPLFDQRGAYRSGANDIGAYEYNGEFGTHYTATYVAGSHGTISGINPQAIAANGNGTEVTAVPDSGYHFLSWSDSAFATAARTDTNVGADFSVTANFESNNTAPTFSSVSDSPDPVNAGSDVTFSATASDPDNGNTVALYVCKSNDFTGSACGASGEWCHSSASASNPSCPYTVQSGDAGTKNYYAYIIDNNGAAASGNPINHTFTAHAVPTVTLSAASSITSSTATIGGNVTADGADTNNVGVTVYWGTTNHAGTATGWDHSADLGTQGIAAFHNDLTNLSANTTYYFTAKATNAAGTSWPAASLNFTTGLLTISGSPAFTAGTPAKFGTQLTVGAGTLNPSTHLTYTWYRSTNNSYDGGDTSLGTGTTYTPVSADIGKYIIVKVSSTDAIGTATVATTSTVINSGSSASTNTSDGNATIVAPDGFSSGVVTLNISKTDNSSAPAASPGLYMAGDNYFTLTATDDHGDPVTTFDQPVTFTISYGSDVESRYNESTLDVYKNDNGTWVKKNCTLDTSANTLTCSLSSFSTYGVLGEENSGNSDSSDEEESVKVKNVEYSADKNSITINWETNIKSDSKVKYGLKKGNLNKEKSNWENEKTHKIVLKDLESNTEYFFKVNSEKGDEEDSSKIHSIKTLGVDLHNYDVEEKSQRNYSGDAKPNVCSYTIEVGDNLWTVAKKVYGDATAYPLIIKKNKDKYPNIEKGKLSIGQELSFDCEEVKGESSERNIDDNKNQISQTKEAKWWNPFSWF